MIPPTWKPGVAFAGTETVNGMIAVLSAFSVTRDRASGAALKDLVSRMFGGSSEAMLMALINTQQITPEQLTRAAEMVKRGDDEGDDETEAK